jgi:hypothetical protein
MATAATPKYKLFRVFMFSPPLSDSEGSVATPGSRFAIGGDLILFCGIMRIFRTGLQKLPTWLKKILSSRPGLGIFERMIAVLTFGGRPRTELSFCVATG